MKAVALSGNPAFIPHFRSGVFCRTMIKDAGKDADELIKRIQQQR
jgi:hypothetical protein